MNICLQLLSCGLALFVELKDISSTIGQPEPACDRVPCDINKNRLRYCRSPCVRDGFEVRRADMNEARFVSIDGREAQVVFTIEPGELPPIVLVCERK